ncbi:MAG: RNA polymerase sigma factor [Terriglobales bacterium]
MDKIASGDEQAFQLLYSRHSPRVLGMLVRMLRERSAAEDVLQETFLVLWREAARFDVRAPSALPWLLVVARNRALDRLRSALRSHEVAGEEWLAPAAGAPSEPWRAVDAARARAAMASLSERERTCLELAYFEGLTQSEISLRLGEPLGTVKSWVRSGLARLRLQFEPAGASTESARNAGEP